LAEIGRAWRYASGNIPVRISLEMKSAEAPARTPIRLNTFTVSAWDGLPLHVREWRGNGGGPPVLGLPGFVRTSGDFSAVADALDCARMVSLDYPGRGQSGRSHDVRRYAPEACLGDVLDVCAALHLHGVAVLGTSFGGLLAMGLGAARPGLLRAVVLNDVGPEIGRAGADFVGRYVGEDPALPDLEACIAYLRASLPPLSLSGEEDWRQMGRLTYGPGPDGRWHPLWDTRIVRLLREPPPDLWPMFRALAHIPLLLVRGGLSEILLPATVARMTAERPDMQTVTLPHIGHGPILTEPEVLPVLRAFLAAVG
jgi:pimeloyl-ACP methyl ester carboxylesterase